MTDSDNKSKGESNGFVWIAASVPVILIITVALAFVLQQRANGPDLTPSDASQSDDLQGDYFIIVRTIELYDTDPSGADWDSLNNSGPDIQFELTRNNTVVFKSSESSDAFIGVWDALSLDVVQTVRSGGEVNLTNSINAPVINVQPGTELTLDVWDSDIRLPGSDRHNAGSITLNMDEMVYGDNTLEFEFSAANAVKRVELRIISRDLSTADLVAQATAN